MHTLLAWLRGHGGVWEPPPAPEAMGLLLVDDAVRVTLNRQFATLDTAVSTA